MSQSPMIRTIARIVATQPVRLQQNNNLCPYYNEHRFYSTATRPTATSTSGFAATKARVRHIYHPACYSTSAASPGKVEPPDYLNDKERHIFDKLVAQLEPSRLEVCCFLQDNLISFCYYTYSAPITPCDCPFARIQKVHTCRICNNACIYIYSIHSHTLYF